MEHINNDMDELFRKAAGNYPLKTDGLNWNEIEKRLNEPNDSAGDEEQSVKQKRHRKYWLLLLLPLILISYVGYRFAIEQTNNSSKEIVSKNNNAVNAGKLSVPEINKRPEQAISKQARIRNEKNTENSDLFSQNKLNQQNKFSSINSYINKTPNNKNSFVDNKSANNNSSASNQAKNQVQPGFENKTTINSPQIYSLNNSSLKKDNTVIKDSALINQQTKSNQQAKIKQKLNTNQKGLYAGIFLGPDLSTIKFQSTKNVGYNLGLLAGYQFNKYLSVETGVIWDNKKYYTDGKYFNKQRTNIPASVQLINVNGSCSMFEIPINVKYNLANNKKGNFFAAAGLSSYIMKNEKYNYLANYYGQQYYSSKSYNNSTDNFFSVMHVSAGYEHKFGRIGNIRIEPYAKFPLTGVGIGKLPITSAGVYIGITRSITKQQHK